MSFKLFFIRKKIESFPLNVMNFLNYFHTFFLFLLSLLPAHIYKREHGPSEYSLPISENMFFIASVTSSLSVFTQLCGQNC